MLHLIWLFVLCCSASSAGANNGTVLVDIGVIYDKDSQLGKLGSDCIQMAISEFYSSHGQYKTRIALHTGIYHSNDSVVGAASTALNLLKFTEVKAIIGPTKSMDAEFVIHLGQKAQVPIISYSTTSPCVSSGQCPYFFSVAQKVSFQVNAITALIKKFQWKDVVPIYVDNNEYGLGLIPYLDDALWVINARIPYHEAISSTATDEQIRQLLNKLKKLQTRVFVVHMSPDLASRLFLRANELNMMGQGYVWIATTCITDELGSLDDNVIESMQGVVGVQTYFPDTSELKHFKNRWKREFPDIELNVMGLWAYDAAWALARAVEQVAAPNTGFNRMKMSGNVNDLDSFGVSLVGSQLMKELQNTSFRGLAGNFSLVDGILGSSSSTYRIINVFGRGSSHVGFWTSDKGLIPNLDPRGKKSAGLRPIIWPGDVTSPPKGWQIPASGRKLKVGVPVKPVYQQIINATIVPGTAGTPSSTNATGFCIDIFETVMRNLGYSHHYYYDAYAYPNGSSAGTYDELVHQVFLQKYDIVVGDVTIIAKRSSDVDFTLPFTESGVTLVVPVRNDKQSAWVFLHPLTWDLWVATLCTFIFIAFAIWVLEHRINDEFRGPPLQQAGTSLFYSFSMMVFAQKENVFSNLSRCVVVVWVFVVLVLTQSYTASLTSILTVQQLQPTVTSIDELLNTQAYVGIQEDSFVKDLLRHIGFPESKIITYNTSQNLDDLMTKGSENGGIAAVFDEMPFLRLFLAQYPSKYMMLQPIYKTDGFGFAFPKGSPLVSEVSGEILKVTEGVKMQYFEKKWGMQLSNTSDLGNTIVSTRLSVDSFWGLFIIVGIAAGSSLLIFLVQFLYQHRDIWMHSNDSLGTIIQRLAKAFESRDMAASTFKKKYSQAPQHVETDQISINDDCADREIPMASITPPRPSNFSDRIEENVLISAGASPPQHHLDSEFTYLFVLIL